MKQKKQQAKPDPNKDRPLLNEDIFDQGAGFTKFITSFS